MVTDNVLILPIEYNKNFQFEIDLKRKRSLTYLSELYNFDMEKTIHNYVSHHDGCENFQSLLDPER